MFFAELPWDVLLYMFMWLGGFQVLRLSHTCKYLRIAKKEYSEIAKDRFFKCLLQDHEKIVFIGCERSLQFILRVFYLSNPWHDCSKYGGPVSYNNFMTNIFRYLYFGGDVQIALKMAVILIKWFEINDRKILYFIENYHSCDEKDMPENIPDSLYASIDYLAPAYLKKIMAGESRIPIQNVTFHYPSLKAKNNLIAIFRYNSTLNVRPHISIKKLLYLIDIGEINLAAMSISDIKMFGTSFAWSSTIKLSDQMQKYPRISHDLIHILKYEDRWNSILEKTKYDACPVCEKRSNSVIE